MTMGAESSQLREATDARLAELQRGGRVIGPPMSPTPPSSPEAQRNTTKPRGLGANHNDARSPDPDPSKSVKKKKKKKKKKRRESLGTDGTNDPLDAATAAMADDTVEHAPAHESHKKRKSKKSRGEKHHGAESPDAQHLLVSHALGGSPPSGQQPAMNGVAEHAPTLDTEVAEQEVIPASSVEDIEPAQVKSEPGIDADDVQDHELPFRIADDSIVDGDYSRQKSPFMHKRQMSIVDDRSEPQSDDELPLPDLQPGQIKTEPPSSESESDLASPSVARLDRLERSRSRSISRPPLVKPANQSVSIYMHPYCSGVVR